MKSITVRCEYEFSVEDLEKAKKWAKKFKYTYERDKEWGGLLMLALREGVIEPDLIHVEEWEANA